MAIIHLIKALSNFVENVENPNYSIVSVAQAEKYLKKQAADEKAVEDEEVIEEVIEVEEDDQAEGTDELTEAIDNFEGQEEESVDNLIDSMSEGEEDTQVEATEAAVDELEEAIDDFEKPVENSASELITETPDSTFWDGLKSALDENPNVAPKDYDDSQDSTVEVLEDPEAVEDLSDLTEDETKIAVQAYNYFMKQGQDKSFEDEDFDGEIIDEDIAEEGDISSDDSDVGDLDDSAIDNLVDGLDFDSPTFIDPSTSIDLGSKGDDTDIDYLEDVEPETTIDPNSISTLEGLSEENVDDSGLADDHEVCAECGFDHEYEPEEAQAWHQDHKAGSEFDDEEEDFSYEDALNKIKEEI